MLRCYRALLVLLPPDLRRFAPEMEDMLRRRLRGASGGWEKFTIGARATVDVLSQTIVARLGRRRGMGGDAWRGWIGFGIRDLAVSVRGLMKRPTFTLIACLTLALGVGANSAIFSLVDGLLLRPLPYPDPSALVVVWEDRSGAGGSPADEPTIADALHWQEEASTIDGLAYFWPSRPTVDVAGATVQLAGAQLSQNTLDVLGVAPAIGRAFLPSETAPGGPNVVILGHGFWITRFGGDPSILGQALRIDGAEHLVVGVMPDAFRFVHLPNYSETPDVLLPFQRDPRRCTGPNECYRVTSLARLAQGAGRQAAEQELQSLATAGMALVPERVTPPVLSVVPLREQTVAEFRPYALALVGMVTVLLLVACANVMSLMLGRAELRRSELAMRGALGASRRRLLGLLSSESVVLGLCAGAMSVLAAVVTTPALIAMLSQVVDVPRRSDMGFDVRSMVFALVLSLSCALVTGLLAALSTLRRMPAAGADRSRGTAGGRRSRPLWWLAVLQVASAFVLVAGTGLLYRGVTSLIEQERGYRTEDLLTIQLPLIAPEYEQRADNLAFIDQVSERLRALPGVEGTAATSSIPLDGDGGGQVAYTPLDGSLAGEVPMLTARFRGVSPEYFDVMGIELLRGRSFEPEDRADTPRVLIMNESAAARTRPGSDPLGQRIAFGPVEFLVVGVVADVRSLSLDQNESPVLYRPLTQGASDYTTLVVRSEDPSNLAASARAIIGEAAPNLAGVSVATMDDVLHASVAPQTITMQLTAALSALALMLAVLGVYGLAGYQVEQETAAIGVRLALGSTASEVSRSVVLRGLRMVGSGLALGVLLAVVGSGALTSLLYDVSPRDPTVLVSSLVFVAIAGLLALYVPARRASRLEPVQALRGD